MQRFQNKIALKRKVETPLCDTWLVEHMRGPSVFFTANKRNARADPRARFCPPCSQKALYQISKLQPWNKMIMYMQGLWRWRHLHYPLYDGTGGQNESGRRPQHVPQPVDEHVFPRLVTYRQASENEGDAGADATQPVKLPGMIKIMRRMAHVFSALGNVQMRGYKAILNNHPGLTGLTPAHLAGRRGDIATVQLLAQHSQFNTHTLKDALKYHSH